MKDIMSIMMSHDEDVQGSYLLLSTSLDEEWQSFFSYTIDLHEPFQPYSLFFPFFSYLK